MDPKKDRKSLARAIFNASHLRGSFMLRSGQISNEYFDKYMFESNPSLLNAITEQLASMIPRGTEVLAGLEMGGIPVATALSLRTGLPMVFVRKTAKEYGTCKVVEGVAIEGKNVCIIEDVVTTGGQIILSAGDLRKAGAVLQHVLCVIERDRAGRGRLAGEGLELISLFTIEDLKEA